MMHRFCYCALMTLILAASVCNSSPSGSRLTPVQYAQPDVLTIVKRKPTKYCNELFIKANSLDYNGYNIIKLQKKVRDPYPVSKPSKPQLIDVFYTVLKKDGRTVAEIDGFYYGLGNSNDFGLFPVLGGKAKQLFIRQAAPRSGRHWVVDLDSPFRVIFDSYDYQVGGEDFNLVDVDGDGIYEILLEGPSFSKVFAELSMADTPLPMAVFKYDWQERKYLPANHLVQDYALKGSDYQIKQLKSDTGPGYLSDRLDILLRYIYAGKENEGWSFFDREYQLADKAEVKSRVESVLKQHPFYKSIYSKRAG